MRLPLSILVLFAVSLPVSAGMRPVHPQPSAETMRAYVEETGSITSKNAEAYGSQRKFDERMDQTSQRVLGSVCASCSRAMPKVALRVSPPKEMRQATDAETIYRGKNFDRARARID